MHEVSLCESIIKIIQRQAKTEGFTRVVQITLTVGDRSGASIESLEFCFPMVAKDTVADGAKLVIQQTSGPALRVSELEVVD